MIVIASVLFTVGPPEHVLSAVLIVVPLRWSRTRLSELSGIEMATVCVPAL